MKILIITPSWIGDTVISHNLYHLLLKKYCFQVQIDVVTPIWCKPVIKRMVEINRIFYIPYNHGSLKIIQCFKLAKLLKIQRYNQAIILPNSLKSALVPFLASIPIRTGWKGEMRYGFINDLRILNKQFFPKMVHRYSALAYDFNSIQNFSDLSQSLPQLYIKKTEVLTVSFKFNLNKKKIIGLCPGSAKGLVKSWPHYYFINLAIQLIYCGYHVIILGLISDCFLINDFIKKSSLKVLNQYCDNLIGRTSLDEAIVIMTLCSAIVSNDSGLMHIACALHKPVVGLYGITNPYCTPPLFYKNKIVQNIKPDTVTFSEIKIKKKFYNCYHNSLISISPNQVFGILKKLLH